MKVEKFPNYEGLLDGFRKKSEGDGGAHYMDVVVLRNSIVLRGEHAAPQYEDINPRFTLTLAKDSIKRTENLGYFTQVFNLLAENDEKVKQKSKIKQNKSKRGK